MSMSVPQKLQALESQVIGLRAQMDLLLSWISLKFENETEIPIPSELQPFGIPLPSEPKGEESQSELQELAIPTATMHSPLPFAVHHFQTGSSDTGETEAPGAENGEIDPLSSVILVKGEPLDYTDMEPEFDAEDRELLDEFQFVVDDIVNHSPVPSPKSGKSSIQNAESISNSNSPSESDRDNDNEQAVNLDLSETVFESNNLLKAVLKSKKTESKNPSSSSFPRIKTHHLSCTVCLKPFTFSTRDECAAHIKLHTGAMELGCVEPGCGQIFTRKDHLRRHQRNLHSEYNPRKKDNELQCKNCGKTFSCPEDCSAHEQLHTGENKKGCLEPYCGKKFTRMGHLRRHQTNVHSKSNFKPKLPPTKSTTKIVINKKSKTPTCEICAQEFSRMYHLNRHILTIHPEIQSFNCPICKQKFGQKGILEAHQKYVHSSEFIPAIRKRNIKIKRSRAQEEISDSDSDEAEEDEEEMEEQEVIIKDEDASEEEEEIMAF